MRLASGQGSEVINNTAWGTPVCTVACVCSTKVRSKFLLWANGAAPSNYCAGCLCYRLCYRVVGAPAYCCYADYGYLHHSSTLGELKTEGEQTQTLTFPCIETWEILGVCVLDPSWVDTGICATTTECCVCARPFGTGTVTAFACNSSAQTSVSCCAVTCLALTGSNPTNVYCNIFCMCVCTVSPHLCGGGTGANYRAISCFQGRAFPATTVVGCVVYADEPATYSCSFTSTGFCCGYPAGYNACNFVTAHLIAYTLATSSVGSTSRACSSVCSLGGCFVQCYYCYAGAATSCCTYCNHSLCDTYGCYCVLDGGGVLNWLAIAYS